MPAIEDGNGAVERVARGRRLFEFQARAQELKAPRVRDVQSYEHVLWLGELPSHTAVSFDVSTDAPPDRPVLVLRRVTRSDPPPSPPQLEPWLACKGVRADQPPRLADSIARPPSGDGSAGVEVRELLSDHPEARRTFDDWLPIWSEWAERDRVDQVLQGTYRDLFNSYELSSSKPDEYELAIGVGCLAWRSSSAVVVRRHLLTSPARLDLDESSGDLVATVDSGVGFQFETDMFDPGQIPPGFDVDGFTRDAAADGSHPLDAEAVGRLARRLTLSLGPESTYGDALDRPSMHARPVGVLAPALILRRRSTRGLVQLLREIGRQLESAVDSPAGLRPLVDPDFVRDVDHDPQPGGLVAVDDEVFQAMPVNARQQQVIANVDSYAQTLVQGPPGTGKTHTAAALLTHLLAQGKRVLITAQTDRALKEVRGKLPAAIQPLAVSVLGASRADTADLKTAVETIASQAGEFDRAQADRDVDERLAAIDALRRERATVYRRLRDTRERERGGHGGDGRPRRRAPGPTALWPTSEPDAGRPGRIVDHLAQALGKAVRSGHLLAEGRGASVSYRLAEQPTVRRRQLGPRLLADVPPAELAALLDDAASLHGWGDHELIFREVLSRIGLRRLTTDARRVLVKALAARARSVTEPT